MANIIFYEKTGCVNNTKQKQLLTLAGHNVEAIDLIRYPWTSEELLSFFNGLEVKKWFNQNAPAVSSGEIIPEKYSVIAALDAMLADHLLIKRPLMIIDGHKLVGFDKAEIDRIIGLDKSKDPKIEILLAENLTDCPQKAINKTCD